MLHSERKSLSVDWQHVFSRKTEVITKHPGYELIHKPTKSFHTGSIYTGQWNAVGMAGSGSYIFPHGVVFEGAVYDSEFKGEGRIQFPMDQVIEGTWLDGNLKRWRYVFADGQEYDVPWDYCRFPDRRFRLSHQHGLRCAGKELRTNAYVPRKIPEGCYDTGDGFYNPKIKCVVSAIDSKSVLRIPTIAEEQWIMTCCRKAWDEPTGYRPDIYRHWTSGSKKDNILDDQQEQDTIESASSGSSVSKPDSLGSRVTYESRGIDVDDESMVSAPVGLKYASEESCAQY